MRFSYATAVLPVACVLFVGCASYTPMKVDLPDHEAKWQVREGDVATQAITQAQLEAMALHYNTALRVMRAQAGVASAVAGHAGAWEDPALSLGLSRNTAGGVKPWLIEGGLSFTIPLSGRMDVQKKLAAKTLDQATLDVLATENDVLLELRTTQAAYAAECAKVAAFQAHLGRLAPFRKRAAQLAKAGEVKPIEARALDLTAAEVEANLAQAQAQCAGERLRLLEILGLRPEAPLVLPTKIPSFEAAKFASAQQNVFAQLRLHPRLAAEQAAYAAAEENLHLEICRQYPDLNIGPAAKWENGQTNIGLGLGLPIPAWNRNKPAIAKATATRTAAKMKLEQAYENLRHALALAQVKQEASRALLARLNQTVKPLIEVQDKQTQQLVADGELDPLRLADVLDRRLNLELRLIDAAREAAQNEAQVRALLDPVSK